jgi:hypothetical protein
MATVIVDLVPLQPHRQIENNKNEKGGMPGNQS